MSEFRRASLRTTVYWALTLFIALEMVAGSFWDVLRIEYVRVVMAHLGYPPFLPTIIGVWKLPCAVALLLPRFPRLKEWAYAGAFFNYYGAVASHLFAGDGPHQWAGPLVFAGFAFGSWALRPPSRRLPPSTAESCRPVEWLIPIAITAVMIVVALVSIPKGPPPGY